MLMNKRPVEKMLAIIEERADKTWPAMYKDIAYKRLKDTLAKRTEDITYVDKENVRSDLRLLCMCVGIDYYRLLMRVHDAH